MVQHGIAVVGPQTGGSFVNQPPKREVFTLRVTERMPYSEIAKMVESTEGARRVHYHNAMRAIKEYLSDD